jgi:hypothetical protein
MFYISQNHGPNLCRGSRNSFRPKEDPLHTIQQYSKHLHTNSTQNTENGTYITTKKLNRHKKKKISYMGIALRAPSLRVIPKQLPYK